MGRSSTYADENLSPDYTCLVCEYLSSAALIQVDVEQTLPFFPLPGLAVSITRYNRCTSSTSPTTIVELRNLHVEMFETWRLVRASKQILIHIYVKKNIYIY